MSAGREEFELKQRLDDLVRNCVDRYEPCFTRFLEGAELVYAQNYVKSRAGCLCYCFGGFPNAQRCSVGIFPSDIYDSDAVSDDDVRSMFDISGVFIQGSGYRKFTHRDILGSLLSLGIKRETVGDIYVAEDGFSAHVAVSSSVSEYLCESLEFIANDRVKVSVLDALFLPEIKREFRVISGTVASFRLDCVLSLCTGQSREKSKRLVESGFVSLNHREVLRCDMTVCENDILSVRGYGRFEVFELGDTTKKGRNRIVVRKMI